VRADSAQKGRVKSESPNTSPIYLSTLQFENYIFHGSPKTLPIYG
jgi:hypothetical protein